MSSRSELRLAEETVVARFSALLVQADGLGQDLPQERLPDALGDLERVKARLLARLTAPASGYMPPMEDRLLTVGEAAQRLALAPDTLYRKARTLPFTVRIGHQVRFSSAGIEKFIRARHGR